MLKLNILERLKEVGSLEYISLKKTREGGQKFSFNIFTSVLNSFLAGSTLLGWL